MLLCQTVNGLRQITIQTSINKAMRPETQSIQEKATKEEEDNYDCRRLYAKSY